MKKLYANLVLWLIRPALEAHHEERKEAMHLRLVQQDIRRRYETKYED